MLGLFNVCLMLVMVVVCDGLLLVWRVFVCDYLILIVIVLLVKD